MLLWRQVGGRHGVEKLGEARELIDKLLIVILCWLIYSIQTRGAQLHKVRTTIWCFVYFQDKIHLCCLQLFLAQHLLCVPWRIDLSYIVWQRLNKDCFLVLSAGAHPTQTQVMWRDTNAIFNPFHQNVGLLQNTCFKMISEVREVTNQLPFKKGSLSQILSLNSTLTFHTPELKHSTTFRHGWDMYKCIVSQIQAKDNGKQRLKCPLRIQNR